MEKNVCGPSQLVLVRSWQSSCRASVLDDAGCFNEISNARFDPRGDEGPSPQRLVEWAREVKVPDEKMLQREG